MESVGAWESSHRGLFEVVGICFCFMYSCIWQYTLMGYIIFKIEFVGVCYKPFFWKPTKPISIPWGTISSPPARQGQVLTNQILWWSENRLIWTVIIAWQPSKPAPDLHNQKPWETTINKKQVQPTSILVRNAEFWAVQRTYFFLLA